MRLRDVQSVDALPTYMDLLGVVESEVASRGLVDTGITFVLMSRLGHPVGTEEAEAITTRVARFRAELIRDYMRILVRGSRFERCGMAVRSL